MAWSFSNGVRSAMVDAIVAAADAGAGAALLRLYDGTRPATGGTATTLLAELTFSNPVASGATNGVVTLSAITADSSANATGTATWARIVDSAGNFVADCNVGTSASDINLNTVSITSGVQVSITSASWTAGNA